MIQEKSKFEKTEFERLELKKAKSNYKSLQKNEGRFNATLNEILTAFSNSKVPHFGSLVFNGQRV
jgi:hypothetical protein